MGILIGRPVVSHVGLLLEFSPATASEASNISCFFFHTCRKGGIFYTKRRQSRGSLEWGEKMLLIGKEKESGSSLRRQEKNFENPRAKFSSPMSLPVFQAEELQF